jgi:hypothetical protein
MKFDIAKKDSTTMIATGVIEKNGDYIVCPKCKNERCFLLTENKVGEQIKWRCPKCREYLGGVIQENGTVEKITVRPKRKWILVEINEEFEPVVLVAFRPQTFEEAARRTLGSEVPKIFSIPTSFIMERCESETNISLQNIQQFKGMD